MTQKNKDILLKDLCARVPYGIICKCTYPVNNETTDGEDVLFTNDYEIEGIRRRGAGFMGDKRWYEITFDGETYDIDDDGIKVIPYLRPMSSMTEEEREIYHSHCEFDDGDYTGNPMWFDTIESFDYLTSIHIDCRGLIPMGLALEAPEEMYGKI